MASSVLLPVLSLGTELVKMCWESALSGVMRVEITASQG